MMNDMMKKMKANQEQMQKKLKEVKVKADSGNGAVTIEADGTGEILNIKIDQAKIDSDDTEALEDLILVATNRVLEMAEKQEKKEAQKSLGSMMPGGLSEMFG